MNIKNILVSALVALVVSLSVVAVVGSIKPATIDILGAVGTRFPNGLAVGTTATVTQNKLTIGNSGTAIGNFLFGTSALIGADVTQAASTTVAYDMAVTGALSGDVVISQFASSTPFVDEAGNTNSLGWVITSSKASSTAGYVTVLVANLTGSEAVLSATNIGSTTSYHLVR